MKSAGCLLIVVLEILLFVVIRNHLKNRDNIKAETEASDSMQTATHSLESNEENSSDIGTYVGPYTDRNGHFHQGHVRKNYNLHPDAYRRRASSRYYNHTHIRKHSR